MALPHLRWYERPEGRFDSARTLEDTADLLSGSLVTGPWALRLDVGLTV